LNPTLVIYDELAQARARDLYDALDSSMGARTEPLFVIISTQSHDPEHLLSKLIDDGIQHNDPTIVAHLYETPDDADTWDEASWYASNPALGVFRTLEDLRALAAKAKRMPGSEPAFRNLYLNQRVDASEPLIPRVEWEGCYSDEVLQPGAAVYLGLDLSATTDLCALALVTDGPESRVKLWCWKPKDLLDLHEARDRVPYREWADRGYIEAVPGKTVDYGYVARRIAQICADYHVLGMAYDRWRVDILLREFANVGLAAYKDGADAAPEGGLRLLPWGQGFADMGGAVDALEQAVLERKLKHDGNPVLTWCVSNAKAVSDPTGNRKLDKSKSRFRIDGIVAATMAIGFKAREWKTEEPPSVYDGMTVDQIKEQLVL